MMELSMNLNKTTVDEYMIKVQTTWDKSATAVKDFYKKHPGVVHEVLTALLLVLVLVFMKGFIGIKLFVAGIMLLYGMDFLPIKCKTTAFAKELIEKK